MSINVSDMMSKTLETIEGTASVQEAAKKMKEKEVSSLVVIDTDNQNKPQGIVTERDIVLLYLLFCMISYLCSQYILSIRFQLKVPYIHLAYGTLK
jgi:CBS-domain-containing membrane protein